MKNLYSATRHQLFNSLEDKKTEQIIPGFFWRYIGACLLFPILLFSTQSFGQLSSCEAKVPYFNVNLVGQPSGTWISPSHQRLGHCCGTTGSEECTSFDVTLDPLAVAVSLNIESGAVPSGALYYQINCGPMVPVGEPVCISGPGPHHITFCKPGNNENTYSVTSIQRADGPSNKISRKVCSTALTAVGLKSGTVTWTSIYPGTLGQYNSNLTCTTCISTIFTPQQSTPTIVRYKVCGWPIADKCGYGNYFCDTVEIQSLPSLTAIVSPNPAYFCVSNPLVTLNGSASGGDGNYTYKWLNSQGVTLSTSTTYNATSAGTYSLQVNDGLSTSTCIGATTAVPVIASPTPVVNAGPDQILCSTDSIVNLSGSSSTNSGIWSGGNGTYGNSSSLFTTYRATAAEINSGSVTLTLTTTGALAGCTNRSDQILITFKPRININFNNPSIACYGNTVNLSVNITGGTPAYTYAWNTGETASSINIQAGSFSLLVTDQRGCQMSKNINVSEPSPLTLTIGKTDLTVMGADDGTASANPGGGTAPYAYLWSNGQTTSSINNLSPGQYTVTITDAKGCTLSANIFISNPGCNNFSVTATTTPALCFSSSDGSALADPQEGTGPFTYLWSNGQTNQNATGLSQGYYTLTATDSKGCQAFTGVTITQPDFLDVSATFSNNNDYGVNCNGNSDAFIDLNIQGGLPQYTVSWTGPGGFASNSTYINNIPAGTYDVTIRDNNNCNISRSYTITEPQPLVGIEATSSNNGYHVSCRGNSDAYINITIQGGSPQYLVEWSGPNGFASSSPNISNLAAGTYNVTVKDKNNCTYSQSFSITEPPALNDSSIVSSNTGYAVSCKGNNDAFINLNIRGGTPQYNVQWSGPNNFSSGSMAISSLEAGTYFVTVTDLNNCTVNKSFDITEPDPLSAEELLSDNNGFSSTCNGASDAFINLNVQGGAPQYSFQWSGPNGFTSAASNVSNLSAGSYSVVVTDMNNCALSKSFNITEPQPLDGVTTTSDNNGFAVSCNGQNDAFINLNIQGGAPQYNIQWAGPNGFSSASANISSLSAGTYSLSITDANNCSFNRSFIINEPPTLNDSSVISSNSGFAVSCNGTSDAFINLNIQGGTPQYNVQWTGPNGFSSAAPAITNLSAGTYSVTVTDANNCSVNKSFNVTEPAPLNANVITSDNNGFSTSCNGAADAFINLNVQGGAPQYSFQWSGPNGFTSAASNLSNLSAGSYSVVITDMNNCSFSRSFNITQPQPLDGVTTTSDNNGFAVSCNGQNDAFINLNIQGGAPQYNIQWTGPNGFSSSSANISSLSAGTYSLSITDANNCNFNRSFIINEPPTLNDSSVISSNSGFAVSCNGTSDAFINLNIQGGTPQYNVQWTGPNGFSSAAQAITNLSAGTYSVIVTDANNCSVNKSFNVTQPDSISISLLPSSSNGNNISCFGGNDGTLNASLAGGVAPFTLAWSGPNGYNGSGNSLNNLAAGNYTLTATDKNGCLVTRSATLSQPAALTAAGTFSDALCKGNADGKIILSVNGGTPGYTYSWNGPGGYSGTTADAENIIAGTYQVSVTDLNGCITSQSFLVDEPQELVLTAAPGSFNGYGISCNGKSDGGINLSVSGGKAPYNYTWISANGYSASSEDINGLNAGDYKVIITDFNGCTMQDSIQIIAPPVITASPAVSNVTCFGGGNGSVNLNIAGGVPGYSVVWNNNTSGNLLTNVSSGIYQYAITDLNGCSLTGNVSVREPNLIDITSLIKDPSCSGISNGVITAMTNGGTAPYQYKWDNGSVSNTISALSAGTYHLIVTDSNSCVKQLAFTLTDAYQLNGDLVSNNCNCYGDSTGMASISMNTGTAPFTYSWSNGAATASVKNLPNGNYNVSVKDINGCTFSKTVTIDQPQMVNLDLTSPVTSSNYNLSGYNSNDGTITASASGGTLPYNFTWSNNLTSTQINNLSAGEYQVTCTDAKGCSRSASITLTQPKTLGLPTGFSPNEDGENDVFVVKGLEAYPSNHLTIINRWGNEVYSQENYQNNWHGTNNKGEALPDATYFVILKINNTDITLTGYVDMRR